MNAAPPVFQAPSSNDALQTDAPASTASTSSRGGTQDFAAALSDAGGKPVRKSTVNKQQEPAARGSSLPAPGNQPPPVAMPAPPAMTDASAAAAAAAAADRVKGAQGSAGGSQPNAIVAASGAPASAGGVGILTLPGLDPAAPRGPALAPGGGAAPATSAAGADAIAPPAVDPSAASSGPSMPHDPSPRTPTAPGISNAAPVPALSSGVARTAKPATTAQGQSISVNSGSSFPEANALNDPASSSGPATAGADATAQAAMAAAAAQGASAPAADSAAANLSAQDSGTQPAAAGGPSSGAPVGGAPGAALAQAAAAAISAATTAATSASVAQAVVAAASAGAADKRTHTPDSILAGASNDGSVGAAQLLTSNTSTDGTPTPTFKVAAGVDTAQFGQGVADRVSLMMDGNLTSAKLQVNPPALGPIEVRIALQGGHAQVWLSSHSAVTRDALESSSPKLREMLGSQGFSQVSVDISQRSFQERSPQSQAYESAPAIGGDVPALAQAPLSMPRNASGLLDAYA